ncbi:MAG: ABC transporter substrate-binding protein, partial [Roseburia sp.]|nr:ABC transporter substrate-binding protein [Roseburia sp.]
ETTAAAIADETEPPRAAEKQPLRVALDSYSYTYSPFYSEGDFDAFITKLTGVRLLERDRSGYVVSDGIGGERRLYNGSYYSYEGIASVEADYDEEADETVFSIRLRDDVVFSDGEPLTADDLIFTLYVLLDPSFSWETSLRGAGIKGEINYRLNSTIADALTEDEIAEALASEEVAERIRATIVEPLLKQELEWVRSLYGETSYSVYTEAYPEPKDLMAFFYAVDSTYRSEEADEARVLSDLADMYGGNYALLGSMYRGDPDYFLTEAQICAIGYLSEQSETAETVDRIEGIDKKGEYEIALTVSGQASADTLFAGLTIAPLHYYGDKRLYSYDDDRFGFVKGEGRAIAEEKAGSPLGAGAYVYERSESGVVYLNANERYYKGTPKTDKLEVLQTSDPVAAVSDGAAELSYPESSALTSAAVESANEALEKLSAYTIGSDGYGFIGINAKRVNIGGDPRSDESIALRKALATAIFLNRDESVYRYFGEGGVTANYPAAASEYLSGSAYSAAAPYEVDRDGEAIYTAHMTEEERFDAAKAACLGFFEAAGYTVKDRLVTEAPEGGSMTFRAIIAAEGKGNHPSYYALTGAKRLLGEIGITLSITDTADASQLWSAINSGTQEIWASVWETGIRPRLSEMYGDDNLFGLESETLAECVLAAETSTDPETLREAFAGAYEMLFDYYAVEIPIYRRSSCILLSTLRVDSSTLPQNMTSCYDWTDEAEKIALK